MAAPAKLISIYINEGDKWRHRPLHLEILRLLHAEGLAGGTVVRAVAGFTGSGGVQTTSIVDAGGKLPPVLLKPTSLPFRKEFLWVLCRLAILSLKRCIKRFKASSCSVNSFEQGRLIVQE